METTDNPRLSELRGLIAGYASSDGCYRTAINSLSLIRRSQSLAPLVMRLPHVLCVAAQGQREVLVGEEVYSCGPDQYFVSAFDIPGSAAIIGASADQPYLGLEWEFDPARIRPLIEEGHVAVPVGRATDRGIYVEPVTPTLLDAVLRLVRLLQHPEEIPVLAPMIEREILFRLLSGKNGAVLHHMTKTGSQSQRIAVAITWLRRNYRQQMRIDQLARHVGMSASSFHHWFSKYNRDESTAIPETASLARSTKHPA